MAARNCSSMAEERVERSHEDHPSIQSPREGKKDVESVQEACSVFRLLNLILCYK